VLVVQESILSPSNMCTLKGVLYCAEYYVNPLRAYQCAIDLLKYIISLSPAGPGFFPYICDAFWQVYDGNAYSILFLICLLISIQNLTPALKFS